MSDTDITATLLRLVRSRCALTVQAASKSGQNDGALAVILQLDTKPADASGGGNNNSSNTSSSSSSDNSNRLIECEMSPAQLYTLLAVLEEAHAKIMSQQSEELS